MRLPRVAIIFDNFGPYHWARLEAAGRVSDLIAIEVRDNCMEHGWVRQPRQEPFQIRTLLQVTSTKKPPLKELSAGLAGVLMDFKPQAVFLPGWSCAAAFLAHKWCMLNSVPAVVMSESNSWDEKRSVLKEWVKRRLARMYSGALVGGTTHREYLVELGMKAECIFPGYDAVDNDHFVAGAEKNKTQGAEGRKQFGLPEKYFLASARFIEKKNLLRLIESYARYRELTQKSEIGGRKLEVWDLVLLGDGPLRQALNARLKALNLIDHVRLPGFKQYDELPAYLGLAGAFIHASTTEQWGLVVNEAMASSLPVLVSNRCGCARDLVRDGVNGFTFDPGNVEELAGLMFKISTPDFPRAELGRMSHEIISNWGAERFGQGVRDAVGSALAVEVPRSSIGDKLLLQMLAAFK